MPFFTTCRHVQRLCQLFPYTFFFKSTFTLLRKTGCTVSEIHHLFDFYWNMTPAFTCDGSSNAQRTQTAVLRMSHVQHGIPRKTVSFRGGYPTFPLAGHQQNSYLLQCEIGEKVKSLRSMWLNSKERQKSLFLFYIYLF